MRLCTARRVRLFPAMPAAGGAVIRYQAHDVENGERGEPCGERQQQRPHDRPAQSGDAHHQDHRGNSAGRGGDPRAVPLPHDHQPGGCGCGVTRCQGEPRRIVRRSFRPDRIPRGRVIPVTFREIRLVGVGVALAALPKKRGGILTAKISEARGLPLTARRGSGPRRTDGESVHSKPFLRRRRRGGSCTHGAPATRARPVSAGVSTAASASAAPRR